MSMRGMMQFLFQSWHMVEELTRQIILVICCYFLQGWTGESKERVSSEHPKRDFLHKEMNSELHDYIEIASKAEHAWVMERYSGTQQLESPRVLTFAGQEVKRDKWKSFMKELHSEKGKLTSFRKNFMNMFSSQHHLQIRKSYVK